MIRICLSGKLGSGKNLFLELAQKNYPHLEFTEDKFAFPIYEIQDLIQQYIGIKREKDGKLLQFIGNHFRDKDPDIWVNWFKQYTNHDNHIITDCRFPNELKACKELGYITVRINRQIGLRANNLGNRDFNHISETALDSTSSTEFDFIINNNGSLEMFEEAVKQVVQAALERQK
jgi:dephospho-CoA kinase